MSENMTIEDFRIGDRVAFLPHTEAFMRGMRYGTVESIGRQYVHVAVDQWGAKSVAPSLLKVLEDDRPAPMSGAETRSGY